jgi:hypothetical protein
MHNLLKHTSLKRQFELRQAAWKPNMEVQEVPLWEIDGVLMGEYAPYPPNPTNEHEMKCFELQEWQRVVHENESDCSTP